MHNNNVSIKENYWNNSDDNAFKETIFFLTRKPYSCY